MTNRRIRVGKASLWKAMMVLMVIVMATELIIMVVFSLPIMSRINKTILNLLDPILLVIFLSPVIYRFLISPMQKQAIREQQKLHEMQDDLTGLPTRKLFMELMNHEIKLADRNGWAMTLIVIDPDRLSEINQIFGYTFGDKVLIEMAARFKALLRQSDIIARISGDEFGLLLHQVDKPALRSVIQKITAALEPQFLIDGVAVDLGATMGIAIHPYHDGNTSLLLRRARVALSKAKRNLEPYAIFAKGYESEAEERIKLFGEIRRSIAKNEFELHYQPKVHMPSGRVVGVEALLRFDHESPYQVAHFIPFAEQIGIITDITRWVFEHAVQQIAAWQASGITINVSLNVSVRDILIDNLMKYLLTLCNRHKVSPTQITLEITESSIMRHAERAIQILQHLRKVGFRISIDDFGTGYSSLSYLRLLPVDELKIDQSFVLHMGKEETDDVLVNLIVDIGSKLNLDVIAEGVENEEQVEKLHRLGCDTIQGYLVARPLPPEELEFWYRKWSKSHVTSR